MITLTKILNVDDSSQVKSINFTLALTSEERSRSRYRIESDHQEIIWLNLPRGTILQDGDLLQSESGEIIVKIIAKPEPVLTVTSSNNLTLLRAAYHLGNRHIPLEITANYLRLSPDSVLQSMLEHLGVNIKSEIAPFNPEKGAYHHH
ncbi:MAG TPA: urease accessory protein UreE [Allocoleopsis sp.]